MNARSTRALLVAAALFLGACGAGGSHHGAVPSRVHPSPVPPTHPAASGEPAPLPAPHPAPPSGRATGREGIPRFGHVFVLVMENLGYRDALRLPYVASLARRYALATRYYAVTHPSLPNYLALAAGRTFVTSDCWFCYQRAPNLASQLAAAHISWGAYMEGLPSPCWIGPVWPGGYAGKHDPFRYFEDVRSNRSLACRIRPLAQLETALAPGGRRGGTGGAGAGGGGSGGARGAALAGGAHGGAGGSLPDFVWITPNLCHDMHSCAPATGDRWLAGFVPRILKSPAWRDGGVLFITWDEAFGSDRSACCGLKSGGGHVATLVIAPGLPAGLRVAVAYDHYSLLRTIEDAWGLGYLGGAGAPGTRAMSAFWARTAGGAQRAG